ncbi:MAG: OmpA family protein [Gammaproteobacteria bacterium]|nr:OmpA family protein [Gammaproteobacteria bacterium]MBU1442973.1 OmpA family protein [Gammaproteobacteria bacterium]MBU2408526.1 OmpA family protein [Gammaproteobacteria bacterium]
MRLLGAAGMACLLAACSTPGTRVILLPQADGRPSAVVVRTDDGEETLSVPFQRATASVRARGAPTVDKADPEQVRAGNRFLFDLLPPAPQEFVVYFDRGGLALTPASRKAMNEAIAAARLRNGGEIVLTGHTDTVGSASRNDELSRQRALQVRQLVLDQVFPLSRIEVVGRGERDLAVKTPDEVDESRNRRVTIEVR